MPGKQCIPILILSVFISACGAQEQSTKEDREAFQAVKAQDGILGSWKWIETQYASTIEGAASEKATPKTTGTDMHVTFQKDSVIVYHNGRQQAKYQYKLIKPSENEKFLRVQYKGNYLDPGLEEGPVYLYNDTLQVVGSANDAGGDQKFRRLQ